MNAAFVRLPPTAVSETVPFKEAVRSCRLVPAALYLRLHPRKFRLWERQRIRVRLTGVTWAVAPAVTNSDTGLPPQRARGRPVRRAARYLACC